ncbi:MAG: hypothetical protein ACK40X_03945, partial [Armatimonadota bacterium]
MKFGRLLGVTVLTVMLTAMAVSFYAAQQRRQLQHQQPISQAPAIRSYQPLQSVPMPLDVIAVRILLGLEDAEPTKWIGEFKLSEGELISALPWRIGAGDRISPDGKFVLSTRRVAAGTGGKQAITENGLVLILRAPLSARI